MKSIEVKIQFEICIDIFFLFNFQPNKPNNSSSNGGKKPPPYPVEGAQMIEEPPPPDPHTADLVT